MNRILAIWKSAQEHASNHHRAYHHTHNGLHACYFAVVMSHGPYHLAAGGLLALMIVGYMLKLEG